MSTYDTIRDMSAYTLAGLAECGTPDSRESAGAEWLTGVRDSFLEAVDYFRFGEDADGLPEDEIYELSDSAVPTYTLDTWAVFTDLALYGDDESAEEYATRDMTEVANYVIRRVAERLLTALLGELALIDDEADSIAEAL